MALSFFDPTLAPYLKKIDPDIQAQQIGLVFMSIAGVYMFVAPIIGYIADKSIPGRVCIIIGQFGLCIGFCFIGPSPFLEKFIPAKVWLVAVSGGFIGLAIAPFVVPTLPDMQKTGRRGGLPATLGTDSLISGLFNGFFSIGSVLGPTIGGALSQQYSFEGAAMVCEDLYFFPIITLICIFMLVPFAKLIYSAFYLLRRGRDPPDGFQKLDEEDDNDGNQVMV
ncbi:MFS-type transporter SLC18B1-like [Clytia hemisphaerica]|uniref:MFS-type transporter SLC18B1-like n=1 Tax=Clytia hemisphaerica TaxID=252671 RepID=UPI0034D559CD